MKHPAPARVRPLVDGEADELDAESLASVLLEDVDVREIRQPRVGCIHRPGEAHLRVAVEDADDAVGALDQVAHVLSRSAGRPVRLLRDEAVHLVEVDSPPVVVEHVAAG
ncbi:MAG: hypothetical protein WKF41_11905 [Gaiellaceae bacterium]